MRSEGRSRVISLDAVRGIAALLVCADHLRSFLVQQSHGLHGLAELAAKVFFFVTSQGGHAVMVFFVLSGYFVAGSVVDARKTCRWRWRKYFIARASRLGVVLIPALILTLIWDWGGRALGGETGYNGAFREIYGTGPTPSEPANDGAKVFFGNLGFLQTIVVPVYGSNGPLWSLANEGWYYVIFPLVCAVAFAGTWKGRLGWLAATLILVVFLPLGLLLFFGVWMAGYGAWEVVRRPQLRRIFTSPFVFLCAMITFIECITVGLMGLPHSNIISNYIIGISFAVMIPTLVSSDVKNDISRRLSIMMADFSYTLYLVHYPILAALFFVFFRGRQMEFGLMSLGVFVLFFIGLLVYASAIWWIFERNTSIIRKFLEKLFIVRSVAPNCANSGGGGDCLPK
jgi:peptidoglycan/LPS O-acetylase OafA/YrhL